MVRSLTKLSLWLKHIFIWKIIVVKIRHKKVIFAVEITLMDKNALLGLSKNNWNLEAFSIHRLVIVQVVQIGLNERARVTL